MSWAPGLDTRSAVSGNGRYRDQAGDDIIALATCVWRGHELVTLGDHARPLLVAELPDAYSVRNHQRSWTGKTVSYRWRNGGLDVGLRTTLPGPRFRAVGRIISLRWVSGAEPQRIRSLTDDCAFGSQGLPNAGGRRLWLAEGPYGPVVIAASHPIRAIRVVSHMHWQVEFVRPGGALLVVPLLDRADVPEDAARQAVWLSLARQAPVVARERHRLVGDRLDIEGRFPGAAHAPLPAWFALLGDRGGLLRLPRHTMLLRGWSGPFATVPGDRWTASIAMEWIRARLTSGAAATGTFADIPDELAYAGDATWQPGTPMDQLLSLRTWAPLVHAAPEALREKLVRQLTPPTPAALTAGIERMLEPASGRSWARMRQMWDHTGDASYDIDWYNGLVLSGLARAVECAEPAIAKPARTLARACRRQRRDLAEYFAVFHDWSLGSAWSDPRGWLWNADCCHNGMEGLLAEARLCDREGRQSLASHWRYLAARTAVALRASCELPAWITDLTRRLPSPLLMSYRQTRMVTWSPTGGIEAPAESPTIGVQALVSWREITWCTTATRNPYVLAGHFPEWNSLLIRHGSIDGWSEMAKPADRDWIRAYLGNDWRERQAKGDQEARLQAAVFYHLAPIITYRRLVMGEDARVIEADYTVPLHLAEQLLLRGGFTLAMSRRTMAHS